MVIRVMGEACGVSRAEAAARVTGTMAALGVQVNSSHAAHVPPPRLPPPGAAARPPPPPGAERATATAAAQPPGPDPPVLQLYLRSRRRLTKMSSLTQMAHPAAVGSMAASADQPPCLTGRS